MRSWQLSLELLLHYTPMVDSLHLCFPLGRSGRLPLVVCRFLLPWSRFAENRIVLGNVFWQFGPSSFVLGHFFLLSVGLGLDMKWAGVAKFFGPIRDILLNSFKTETFYCIACKLGANAHFPLIYQNIIYTFIPIKFELMFPQKKKKVWFIGLFTPPPPPLFCFF